MAVSAVIVKQRLVFPVNSKLTWNLEESRTAAEKI